MVEESETDFTEVLNKYRVELIKSIDLDRQLMLVYLRSKSILDEEDCQNIRAGTTRQQQVDKFLDVLIRKGKSGYECFLDALEFKNANLFELLTGKKPSKRE